LFTFITTVTVPTFSSLQAQYNISNEQVNYTVAIPALALAVSPLFWSPFADTYGRRTVMIVGCFIAFIATIGSAVANNYGGYMAARFFQGWGVGPASTVGYCHNRRELQTLTKF
jgi:MFS family permease